MDVLTLASATKGNEDMSYEKTNWLTGDVITAERLNKIEEQLAYEDEGAKFIKIFSLNGSNRVISNVSWQDLIDGNVQSISYTFSGGDVYFAIKTNLDYVDEEEEVVSKVTVTFPENLIVRLEEDKATGGIRVAFS